MSFLFGELCAIKRSKELFFCFLEAKAKLFSRINENRLINAIKLLRINLLACTKEEHYFLQKHLPPEFAPFLLLSEQNLLRMHRFILDSRETPNFDFPFPFSPNYLAKSTSLLPNSQSDLTTVTSETPLLQERQFSEGNNRFNNRRAPGNELFSEGHNKSVDERHLANKGTIGENGCTEQGVSNS